MSEVLFLSFFWHAQSHKSAQYKYCLDSFLFVAHYFKRLLMNFHSLKRLGPSLLFVDSFVRELV